MIIALDPSHSSAPPPSQIIVLLPEELAARIEASGENLEDVLRAVGRQLVQDDIESQKPT